MKTVETHIWGQIISFQIKLIVSSFVHYPRELTQFFCEEKYEPVVVIINKQASKDPNRKIYKILVPNKIFSTTDSINSIYR